VRFLQLFLFDSAEFLPGEKLLKRRCSMESSMNSRPEYQLQDRIGRIAEGILMLGGALTGIWLLAVIALSFVR
jgi:hypothetical protein